jgi:hypothetical protein
MFLVPEMIVLALAVQFFRACGALFSSPNVLCMCRERDSRM